MAGFPLMLKAASSAGRQAGRQAGKQAAKQHAGRQAGRRAGGIGKQTAKHGQITRQLHTGEIYGRLIARRFVLAPHMIPFHCPQF